jgi:ribonucleoside-diphosphate reductase alpha chain
LPDETPQDMYARVAKAYSNYDPALAQRLYDYMSLHWFSPATPILANGGTNRGLPISCFLNKVDDTMESIQENLTENFWLAAKGGGIGSHWGNVRSIGEKIGRVGESSGIIPFLKVQDSLTLAVSQGALRRGNAAIYLPVDHPEIEEFLDMRKPTGGDPNRKCLNLNQGIVIKDQFMYAVLDDKPWDLKSPHTRKIVKTISARNLWIKILETRMATGEPYLMFMTHANKARPSWHVDSNLQIVQSNLCSEIFLPTSESRTAVCCLSSLNLETYDQWQGNDLFYRDVFRFLDNVLQDFIERAPNSMKRAKFSAEQERSVGLGVMGFHSLLQQRSIPLESALALSLNQKIFKEIKRNADQASIALGEERGACPDAAQYGFTDRFSYKLAIAPTASISIICGGTSPAIEPWSANAFVSKTLSGTFISRNKYLVQLLESKGLNTPEVWTSIAINEGSVQHLNPELTQWERDVFKTAFELDQRWLIDLAADRQMYICQGQSLNLFVPSNIDVKTLNDLHISAWKKDLKSLYYLRSKLTNKARTSYDTKNDEECIACQ